MNRLNVVLWLIFPFAWGGDIGNAWRFLREHLTPTPIPICCALAEDSNAWTRFEEESLCILGILNGAVETNITCSDRDIRNTSKDARVLRVLEVVWLKPRAFRRRGACVNWQSWKWRQTCNRFRTRPDPMHKCHLILYGAFELVYCQQCDEILCLQYVFLLALTGNVENNNCKSLS